MADDMSWDGWGNHVLEELKQLHETQGHQTEVLESLRDYVVREQKEVRESIASCREEYKTEITKTNGEIAKNRSTIGTHTWFMRILMGGFVLASLTGVFGLVTDCNRDYSSTAAAAQVDSETNDRPAHKRGDRR